MSSLQGKTIGVKSEAEAKRASLLGRWLPGEKDNSGHLLYAFPHAGGTARAFNQLLPHLRSRVWLRSLQLPGRERRWDEAPHRSVNEVMRSLEQSLLPALDGQSYALFGHSLGAKLAFELARLTSARGHPPRLLIVSACPAPQLRNARPKRARFDDEMLSQHIEALGGTSGEALLDGEFRQMFLPYLRADYEISEGYRLDPLERIDSPIVAMGGTDDPEAAVWELEAWQAVTNGDFELVTFPGGHFYFHDCLPDFCGSLAARVDRAMAGHAAGFARCVARKVADDGMG